MAGRGPAPKPAHMRQRRNRKAGAAVLTAPENPRVPELTSPDGREWHPMTLRWWERVWESPMANEYLPSDVDGLERLAVLVDDFYLATSASNRKELLQEIRLQEARFGLSPVDRSRLQWEIEKGEQAARKRQPPKEPATEPAGRIQGDPRQVLRVVK